LAEFHSLPRSVDRDLPDPLTPARHRLRQAIAVVDRARRETEASAERVNRLSDVISEHGRLVLGAVSRRCGKPAIALAGQDSAGARLLFTGARRAVLRRFAGARNAILLERQGNCG
jgi:hypothetical protein